MTIYRKSGDKTGGSYYAISSKYNYDQLGNRVRPYVKMYVDNEPSKFIIPYPNNTDESDNWEDPDNVTGLSSDYIRETRRKINAKHEDDWDGHDDHFINITHLLNHYDSSDRDFGAEQYKEVMGQWGNKHFQPDKLFEYKPSSMEIDSLYSDPSMRASAMNLIAVAKRDLGAEVIRAPQSLSSHSSRLVKKAQKAGFSIETHPSNPDADVTNDEYLFEQTIPEKHIPHYGDEEVSPEVVSGARQDLREMLSNRRQRLDNPRSKHNPKRLRNTKPATQKGLSGQFQPVLPGMEGFV